MATRYLPRQPLRKPRLQKRLSSWRVNRSKCSAPSISRPAKLLSKPRKPPDVRERKPNLPSRSSCLKTVPNDNKWLHGPRLRARPVAPHDQKQAFLAPGAHPRILQSARQTRKLGQLPLLNKRQFSHSRFHLRRPGTPERLAFSGRRRVRFRVRPSNPRVL